METKKKKLKTHQCNKCGKEIATSIPSYLREQLRKQDRLCASNG